MSLIAAKIESVLDIFEGICFPRIGGRNLSLKKGLLIPTIMVSLLILILVMFYTSQQNEYMHISGSNQSGLMYLRVETDKDIYKTAEEIRINFYLVNNKSVDMLVPSLSRGIDISGSSGPVLLLVESYASEGPIKIAANSEYLLGSFVWNQRDKNGKQVPPGTYKIDINLLDAKYDGETSITIE